MCYHGPNVVNCEIFTGLTGNLIVREYLSPSTLKHLPDLQEALKCFRDPIFLGNLNVDLDKVRILRSQCVLDLLAEYDLIDLVRHSQQRRKFRDLNTWSQVRQVTALQSICNYILVSTNRV